MRYEVRIGERRLAVEVGHDGRLAVDGRAVAHEAREVAAGRIWWLQLDGTAHELVHLGGDPARWSIDGREVSVEVVDERTLAAGEGRIAGGGGRHELRAPMPGLLRAVHVTEGQLVERDEPIATLEAMKMENELRSPSRARVSRIGAAAGTKVESGALVAVLVDEPA